VEIPLACTLGPDDARSQLDEWRELLQRVAGRSERPAPNRLELSLIPDSEIESVVRLAQREAGCCPFFSFSIDIRADRLVLVVEVPDSAVEVLDHLDVS
jgi:hypothetical protein